MCIPLLPFALAAAAKAELPRVIYHGGKGGAIRSVANDSVESQFEIATEA
jgi:hypothetical protein